MQSPAINHTVVVVLGGSCFIGRHLISDIRQWITEDVPDSSRSGGGPLVFLLNRGNKYWDKDVLLPDDAAGGIFTWMPFEWPRASTDSSDDSSSCSSEGTTGVDRKNASTVRSVVDAAGPPSTAAGEGSHYQLAVVDFSSSNGGDVRYFFQLLSSALAGRPASVHYTMVSTDSVYSIAQRAPPSEAGQAPLPVQEDHPTVKPHGRKYGSEKRSAELAVEELYGPSCTILRMPDVLGPFDDTSRLMATYIHCRLAIAGRPGSLRIESTEAQQHTHMSFVYGPDVASWISTVLRTAVRHGTTSIPAVCCGCFNVCCHETIGLVRFVDAVLQCTAALIPLVGPGGPASARLPSVELCDTDEDSTDSDSSHDDHNTSQQLTTCDYYPSVSCGPLSASKIVRSCGNVAKWKPTPLDVAISRSVVFAHDTVTAYAERGAFADEVQRALRKVDVTVDDLRRGLTGPPHAIQ